MDHFVSYWINLHVDHFQSSWINLHGDHFRSSWINLHVAYISPWFSNWCRVGLQTSVYTNFSTFLLAYTTLLLPPPSTTNTDSHSHLNFSSSHPTKLSSDYSQFLCLCQLYSDGHGFEAQAQLMNRHFIQREYPNWPLLCHSPLTMPLLSLPAPASLSPYTPHSPRLPSNPVRSVHFPHIP